MHNFTIHKRMCFGRSFLKAKMATHSLLRLGAPLRLFHHFSPLSSLKRFSLLSAAAFHEKSSSADAATTAGLSSRKFTGWSDSEFRKWKDREAEILNDIRPLVSLTKLILHSDRYFDGERLSDSDVKVVADKILSYHPNAQDKIGCGIDSIKVDRHPQFRNSRCLFVVRTDGGWIDFSYQKCLRAYVREKYPSYAERFIREHFKRGS